MEYYSSHKRNDTLVHALNMEYSMIPFTGAISRAVKFIETERMVLFFASGWG